MDHLRHFGLAEDPFRDEPRVRDYCETQASREALLRLERGLRQGRESVWELETRKLEAARRYLELISQRWDAALFRLKRMVEE